jgi:hypothetical protein
VTWWPGIRLEFDEIAFELRRKFALQLLFKISCDFGELGKGGLKVFNDFGGDDGGLGKIGAVFK